ncbi:MAG: hydroxyacid dehydrogenase [Proteobacteria bacterium]|nr:hydroxyacid dehydrogenase [Pseudomonadota bacterium]
MARFKVYVIDPINRKGVDLLARRAEMVLWDDPRARDWPDDADGLIIRDTPVTGEQLRRATRLKAICKHGVGLEKVDLAAARARGIPVMNTPGVNAEAVAELTMGIALAVARRIAYCDRELRRGGETGREAYDGMGLAGKTVGIVGVGNIGRRIARKWQGGFDMTALGYDPYLTDAQWRERGVGKVARLHDLLPRVDLLTIHCPLSDETRGMIGAPEFALMKPTAILVNAARGGIVDEEALYAALKEGRLYGAGLDVFAVEPPRSDHPLFSFPTFVATSHIGAGNIDTRERCAVQVVEQVLEVLEGRAARNAAA